MSPYITQQGYAALKQEYEQLWSVRRPAVVRALSEAAAEGDRSENAEYQYRKKELREIDRRVRYLQRRMPQLQVVDQLPSDSDRVFFGAVVVVADAQGDERRFRIVGGDETDAAADGRISVDAPMARALLGKQVGECVTVSLPGGEQTLDVVCVSYPR